MIYTFDLVLAEEDTLMNHGDAKTVGYYILFRENDSLRKVVTRICHSFLGYVFETSLKTCAEDRLKALQQKN